MTGLIDRQYTLNDLQIGMHVYKKQLQNIFDTYIILNDAEYSDENGIAGTIAYIGSGIDDNIASVRNENTPTACVYNNSSETGDDVYYED
jgi:hypothetical protein